MNPTEWSVFAAELEASFRGDLAPDREAALRTYMLGAELPCARQALGKLVAQGQIMMPAPAELLPALKAVERERERATRKPGATLAPGTVYCEHREIDVTDCPGFLLVTDDDGRGPIGLECDRCDYEVAVARGTK